MFEVHRYLIVDDEASFRKTLSKFLSVYAQISESDSLKSARKLLKEQSFDVVLLDKKLPDGSGLELIPLIQKLHPQASILIVSGDLNLAPIYQAIDHGIDDYVIKSENILQELMVRIPLAIKRHRDALARTSMAQKTSTHLPQTLSEVTPENFEDFLVTSEKEYLQRALELSQYEVTAVAKKLGLARSTLHKKISDYSLRQLSL